MGAPRRQTAGNNALSPLAGPLPRRKSQGCCQKDFGERLRTRISEGNPRGTGFLAQTLSWVRSEQTHLLPGPGELAKRQGSHSQFSQGPFCAHSAGETMPILQPCASTEPNNTLAASSLGPHWPDCSCWKMEAAGHPENGQGTGSTGPLATYMATCYALALPEGKFSHYLANQARTGVAPSYRSWGHSVLPTANSPALAGRLSQRKMCSQRWVPSWSRAVEPKPLAAPGLRGGPSPLLQAWNQQSRCLLAKGDMSSSSGRWHVSPPSSGAEV